MELLFSFFIVLLTTAGQILLKKGAIYHHKRIKSLQFIGLGYLFFVITIVFSYLLMNLIPMKYFTVIMSLNYVTVMFGASIFLEERLEKKKVIGTIIVTFGIMVFIYGK